MKKRILATIMALLLSGSMLVGCGDSSRENDRPSRSRRERSYREDKEESSLPEESLPSYNDRAQASEGSESPESIGDAPGKDTGPPDSDAFSANGGKPSAGSNEPAANDTRPSAGSGEAAANGNKPSAGGNEPSANGSKPSAGSGEPAANSTRPSTGSNEPADNSTRPSTGSNEPAGNSTRPSTGSNEPAGNSTRPSTGSNEPAANGARPSSGGGTADDNSASVEDYRHDIKEFLELNEAEGVDTEDPYEIAAALQNIIDGCDVRTPEALAVKADLQELSDLVVNVMLNMDNMDFNEISEAYSQLMDIFTLVGEHMETFEKAAIAAGVDPNELSSLDDFMDI